MRFENKEVILTGGPHGIGKAIADALLGEGATVHIIDTQPGDWFVGDVGEKQTVERFVK